MSDTQAPPSRIVLAGSVGSTRRTLAALLRHRAPVVGVLELTPEMAPQVSGYARLADLAASAGVPCVSFRNINAPETLAQIQQWNPDLLFVVGLSQLVKPSLLALPRLGCVGFHPTRLPIGRGRAPVAWLTLDGGPAAATFFLMDTGADSGPILVQEPFDVRATDYAADVVVATEDAIERALDRWLPNLLAGEWRPQPQDDRLATYHGKRGPEDGLIDWRQSARGIEALVRAASRPHPGAYTYYRNRKLLVWRGKVEPDLPYRGVTGRVLEVSPEHGLLVQCGEGLIWLTELAWADDEPAQVRIGVGGKLGVAVEDDVAQLHETVRSLQRRIEQLESQPHAAGVQPTCES